VAVAVQEAPEEVVAVLRVILETVAQVEDGRQMCHLPEEVAAAAAQV
jgi:hypothetical protein